VTKAKQRHVPVVAVDLPIGADPATVEPQVPGQVGAVLIPAARWGAELTTLVVDRCASRAPCNVVYLAGAFAIPFDAIALAALDAAAASHPNLHVVARAEAFYDRATAAALTQQILHDQPSVQVIIGAGDQMAAGAEDAIVALGLAPRDFSLIGAGAGALAVNAVRERRWFATFVALPGDEGRLGADIAIRAVRRQHIPHPGIDPVERRRLPRFFTQDNQARFAHFTPEWPG
jgi:ribose transport system substrate-binding protein